MRTVKELLELMLANKKHFRSGLCIWSKFLCCGEDIISDKEHTLLYEYIKNNPPKNDIIDKIYNIKNDSSMYYWTFDKLYPRVRWIKQHIKKLNNENISRR